MRVDAPVSSNESRNSSRIVVWIFASVAKSMLLVASSMMIMGLRRSSARAIAISCFCPCEKLPPPADTWVFRDISVVAGSVDTEPSVRVEALDAARDCLS